MTQMVTRCPKCATAFRITSTQLESAKGAVRCGSCLHIFKAQDYLVKSATDTETPKVAVKPEAAKPAASKSETLKQEARTTEAVKTDAAKVEAPKVDVSKVAASKAEPSKPELKADAATKQSSIPVVSALTETKSAAVKSIAPEEQVESKRPAIKLAPEPEKIVVASKPVIDKAKILEDEDDVLISDDMDSANEKASTYEFDGFVDLDLHPKQTVSLFEREIRYEPPIEDSDEESADESWAEELLDDDGEPLQQFKKTVVPAKPETEESPEYEIEHADKYSTNDTAVNSNKYSAPVFSLISENNNDDDGSAENKDEKSHQDYHHENREEPVFSEAFLTATRPQEHVESTNFAAALFEQEPQVDADSDESDKSATKRPVKSSKMRAFDTSRAALLMNIMPAPVEFTARRMRRWYQKKLWPSLAIIMCVLFFFQLAYFKFDYFSRVEPYRTAYLFICPVVGCEVPSLVDTSQIVATNLIVRNHPDISNALMVDAILINNAPFEQPFPDLILSFSKLDDTPVATRRFTPKEYLAGELAGMKYIPQRQPVHITIEISDPGPDAVNYTLATH